MVGENQIFAAEQFGDIGAKSLFVDEIEARRIAEKMLKRHSGIRVVDVLERIFRGGIQRRRDMVVGTSRCANCRVARIAEEERRFRLAILFDTHGVAVRQTAAIAVIAIAIANRAFHNLDSAILERTAPFFTHRTPMRNQCVGKHAFTGETSDLAMRHRKKLLHVGVACVQPRIIREFLQRMEAEAQPILVRLPLALVRIRHFLERKLVHSIIEVGAIEKIDLKFQPVLVVALLERRHKRIVEKRLRALTRQVAQKPNCIIDEERRLLASKLRIRAQNRILDYRIKTLGILRKCRHIALGFGCQW